MRSRRRSTGGMLGSPRSWLAARAGLHADYSPGAMPRLLLVADTPWVRNEVLAALSEPGYDIDFVEDPRQVTERIAAELPDAVLVDLQVGSMGGMAITRAIRDASQEGEIPDVPVVLLLDRHADTFLAKRSGASAAVVKPFTPQDLRVTLTELLPVGG